MHPHTLAYDGGSAPKPLASSAHTVAAICVIPLLDAARAAGIDGRELPSIGVDPDELDPFGTRIPSETLLTLWEVLMRATRDPGFPVFAAARTRPSDSGAVGFACMTRSTLGEALIQAMRYAALWRPGPTWELRRERQVVILTFLDEDPARCGSRCKTEYILAKMTQAGRALAGTDFAPREVRFRHGAPHDTGAHQAFFAAPVRFGAAESALVIDVEDLEMPLLRADPDLATFLQRQADDLMKRHVRSAHLAERLRAALAEDRSQEVPTLETAASQLGMSARTLRRRLQEEGTSFAAIAGEARADLAKRYLARDRLTLGEVAARLGFSEPSAFHRAFKRWTGQTPSAYRRYQLSAL
jgi:AraC-like DNA-binding protein